MRRRARYVDLIGEVVGSVSAAEAVPRAGWHEHRRDAPRDGSAGKVRAVPRRPVGRARPVAPATESRTPMELLSGCLAEAREGPSRGPAAPRDAHTPRGADDAAATPSAKVASDMVA